VSFLNTLPLVWGMLHGKQRGQFDLEFCLPSECADRLAAGTTDIGIVPSVELPRLDVEVIPGAGIACRGAVRSILLVSKEPLPRIRVLAVDSGSRTSAVLARILLAMRYGAEPRLIAQPPDLPSMLQTADAALVIGDPALRLNPTELPFAVTDLGQEWLEMTGLPFVFAVWAARRGCVTPDLREPFLDSCRCGLDHLDEIVRLEAAPRGFSEQLAREYLTRHVIFELGRREHEGLELFLQYAAGFAMVESPGSISA